VHAGLLAPSPVSVASAHFPPVLMLVSIACPVSSARSDYSSAWLAGPARKERCPLVGPYPLPPIFVPKTIHGAPWSYSEKLGETIALPVPKL